MKKFLLSLGLIFTAILLVACDNSSDPIDEEEPPVIELPELTADDSKANLNTSRKLAIEWDIVEDEVTFMSSDETKATVSSDGVVEFKGLGFVVITAATKNGDVATFIIEVFDVVVVKAGTKTDDSVIVDGLEVFYGEKLVDNLEDAEELLSSSTTLYIKEGTYDTEFAITVDGLKIVTDENVIITRPLIVDAKNIKIENFNFTNEGLITSTLNAENLVIKNNKFDHVSNNAISLYNSESVLIEGNEFNDIDGAAIKIIDFEKGKISINKNIIKNVKDGIYLESN
ncbi:MAG TPA: right-handed parallel beta-helix repeat-containing protein, partial [Acholeplasma sp.]|nr:right-handed parallel beta-helix repeat-containing protein [Acholeplasma sp.]